MTVAISNADVFQRLDRLNKRANAGYQSLVARLAADGEAVDDAEIQATLTSTGKSNESLAADVARQQRVNQALAERETLIEKREELANLYDASEAAIANVSATERRHKQEMKDVQNARHNAFSAFRRAEYEIKKSEQRIAAVLAGDEEPIDGAFES